MSHAMLDIVNKGLDEIQVAIMELEERDLGTITVRGEKLELPDLQNIREYLLAEKDQGGWKKAGLEEPVGYIRAFLNNYMVY